MSTIVTSGGFPHLYSHDVSGSFVDASAVRSVANADVAELHAALEPAIAIGTPQAAEEPMASFISRPLW